MAESLRQVVLTVIRYITVAFNVVLMVFAIGLAIFAISVEVNPEIIDVFKTTSSHHQIWVVIAAVILIVASTVAIYGSYKQVFSLLITYLVLLVIVFVIQIFVEIGVTNFVPLVKAGIKKEMNETMKNYKTNQTFWDEVEYNFKCCGAESPKDWFPYLGNQILPQSCCLNYKGNKKGNNINVNVCTYSKDPAKVHQTGCYSQVVKALDKPVFGKLIIAASVVQFIQIVNIVFVVILAVVLWRETHDVSITIIPKISHPSSSKHIP